MRTATGAGDGRFGTKRSKTDRFADSFKSHKPLAIFKPCFARGQVNLKNPRISCKTEPAPLRWQIDRDVSFPKDRTPALHDLCDRLDKSFPRSCKQRRQENSQMVLMRLQNQSALGCLLRQRLQRKPETGRTFGL